MNRSSGFSLIELLALIAVLAVLVALLFPIASRLHEHTMRTKCAANLRQLGVAARAYANDNNTVYIPSSLITVGFVGKGTSAISVNDPRRFLKPYLGGPFHEGTEVDVARCPADQGGTANAATTVYASFGTSYAFNYRSPRDSAPTLRVDNTNTPFPLVRVERPSQTLMIVCHPAFVYADGGDRRQRWHKGPKPDTVYVNASFVDGSVRFIEIPAPGTTPNYPDSAEFTWERL